MKRGPDSPRRAASHSPKEIRTDAKLKSSEGIFKINMHGKLACRQKDNSLPTQMQEPSKIKRTLIRSYRRWITGMRMNDGRYWSVVWTELSNFLGEQSARSTLGGLLSLIAAIGNFSRRPFRLHPPCCGHVCADELLTFH